MPASLIECGFMDSATDIYDILDPKWSRKIALGIALGICEVFGGTVQEETQPAQAAMSADSFDEELDGAYQTTAADLKLRAGANTMYDVLVSVPKGESVRCYGYYTRETDGTVWLYVLYDGKVGFISKRYLMKR